MDNILISITIWLQASPGVALPAAFLWGMVSVLLSPCHMASIPLLIAYVAGQKMIPAPRQAARYAILFALGIFITIMAVGLLCTVAGRMLGDIGSWWQVAVGILLLWVAWTLFKEPQCSATGNVLNRFQIQGMRGAFILGLAYGTLAGVCTFGFIAPILGIITLQKEIITGILMLVLFGIGHCLPLVVCGMFSARTMELLHSHTGRKTVATMRKLAAGVIGGLAVYFILLPFWS
ncbi:MAG: sulfite exporter TauE/SafE family protein [Proteobacteria bacterium]|nr:sulfite exporter TauE/SafE family protein [Pseudomonadota bacterium]MBU1688602.1 sulfite exporter TauE/SafE family protein [Pseudomonadota bacterium]